MAEQGA